MLPVQAKGETMNTISLYFVQIATTLAVCSVVVIYLRQSLSRILIDLCRTEERARFWLTFSTVILIGLPLIFGMGYAPSTIAPEAAFFEIANQIKWNLFGFLLTLVGIGFILSFFALVAPRPETK
jgi:hypothetical protein